MSTKCICGNCPKIREERGLLPFCQMPTPAPTPPAGFDTYKQADAVRLPGQSIVGIRSGMGHGPLRFVIRGKVAA